MSKELQQPAQQEPVDFASLLREAEEIVREKPTWKRFIDGTPLANDIAVWMTVFAQDVARRASPQAQQEPECWVCNGTGVELDDANTKTPCPNCAEQPAQQEPVGEVVLEGLIGDSQVVRFHMYKEIPPVGAKLYTSPPASKPLTDERIFELASEHQDWDRNLIRVRSFARAIEAAHGIKENT